MHDDDLGEVLDRTAVAGERQVDVEALDEGERRRQLGHRIGRVAVVVPGREDAGDEVAEDEQALLALVEADV